VQSTTTRSRLAEISSILIRNVPSDSHVHIGTNDFDRAFAFYKGMMDELGFTLKFSEPEKPWAGWMKVGNERPLFLIGRAYNGERAAPGNGQMVALLAPNRDAGA
jgi:hypothetical protein